MSAAPLRTLDGKVVLVTGASSGIGRATAIELARRGAKVVVSARRKDQIDALAAELTADGYEATAVQADINVEANVTRLVDATVAAHGRLDGGYTVT